MGVITIWWRSIPRLRTGVECFISLDTFAIPPEIRDPDTSIADYVWLPLQFDDNMVFLDWKDEWRIEDYD